MEFSRPMAAGVGNAADYQLEEVRAKAAGKSKLEHLKNVGLTVTYDTSSSTVTVNLAGKHSFPKGGVLACANTAVAPVPPASRSREAAPLQSQREVRTSGLSDGKR